MFPWLITVFFQSPDEKAFACVDNYTSQDQLIAKGGRNETSVLEARQEGERCSIEADAVPLASSAVQCSSYQGGPDAA